ncbi:MAG: LLM class flavin-dependent oxidoreductase [Alphaproteobacteria bacterium]
MSTFFQNLGDRHTDAAVYAHETSMADLAEPMGFDSVWSAEHHFDNYTMCPNVAQFLTYMAGRTQRVRLGSMVTVLPWHTPVRLAEDLSMLDNLSRGRLILGIGRGLGRVEFEGFGIDMNESRTRFTEYAEALLAALDSGRMEYRGTLLRQPPVDIRPRPTAPIRGRSYAASVSPESFEIMVKLGVGIMIIAQKPWEKAEEDIAGYRARFLEVHDAPPPKPLLVSFVAVGETEAEAEDMFRRYVRGYCRSALDHYEFQNAGLAHIKGYEYYGKLAANIAKHGIDSFVDFLAGLQVWGTPDQVFAKLAECSRRIDAGGVIAVFSFGGMPHDLAKRNIALFADKVLPRLQALETGSGAGAVLARAAA